MASVLALWQTAGPWLVFGVAWRPPSVEHDVAVEHSAFAGCLMGRVLDVL